MSSILLLLEDGEMHPLMSGGGNIVLARHPSGSAPGTSSSAGDVQFGDAVITTAVGAGEHHGGGAANLALGNHFLTTTADGGEAIVKVEGALGGLGPVEVIMDKKAAAAGGGGKKGKGKGLTTVVAGGGQQLNTSGGGGAGNNPSGEKKVCLWPMGNGTTCGKTFTKFDSLKRHLSEAHKGVRPYQCTMCDKSYGRRDYLQRHLKSHNATFTANLNSASSSGGGLQQITKTIKVGGGGGAGGGQQIQVVQVQQPHGLNAGNAGGTVQILQQASGGGGGGGGNQQQTVASIPFLSNLGGLPGTTPHKPTGSKICRWMQNDGTVCGKAFSKLDSLRRHVNELHKSIRPYACSQCEKSYGRRDYLDRHTRTHNKKKNAAASSSSLDTWGPNSGVLMQGDEVPPPPKIPKKKRKDIPPEEKKICLWVMDDGTACGKTFTKFDSLKRHVSEAHKGQRPYSCTLCGKTYGRRDYLLRHLKSHNDAEVANLNISKATPAQQTSNVTVSNPTINFSSLTPHPPLDMVSIVGTGGGPTPAQQASQNNIKMAHSAKKRAAEDKKTCKWVLDNGSVCGRTFSKFDSLRRHVAELHKGIRPFACELCDKTYGRKDYLDRHLRNHAAEDAKREAAEAAAAAGGGTGGSSASETDAGKVVALMEDDDEDEDSTGDVVQQLAHGGVVTVVGD